MKIAFILLGLGLTLVECNPLGYGFGRPRREYHQSMRYNPQQAMMFSGFYGASSSPSYQGSMSAFANKDIVATNSFSGEQYPDATESSEDFAVGEELDVTQASTSKSKKNKKKPTTTPRPDDYDEEEEDDNKEIPALRGPQPGIPRYNSFFPVTFGGGSRRNSNGYPGGAAVAIANSYSSGKGGVASSHATAYGDPYSSNAGRSNGNGKRQH